MNLCHVSYSEMGHAYSNNYCILFLKKKKKNQQKRNEEKRRRFSRHMIDQESSGASSRVSWGSSSTVAGDAMPPGLDACLKRMRTDTKARRRRKKERKRKERKKEERKKESGKKEKQQARRLSDMVHRGSGCWGDIPTTKKLASSLAPVHPVFSSPIAAHREVSHAAAPSTKAPSSV